MKARVRATGEIVEVAKDGPFYNVIDGYERYYEHELDFQDALAYWEKLMHQAAIAAMQGILANCNHQLWEREANSEGVAKQSYEFATALVSRLKEDSQCEK